MPNLENTSSESIELYFSVLEYIPSVIRGEKINVGIAFHIPSEETVKFVKTKNLQRVRAFDDEHVEFYKFVIEQIEDQFTFPKTDEITLEYQDYNKEYDDVGEMNFLSSRTKYYNNQFQFKPVEHVNIPENEVGDYEKDYQKTYLYYDRPKSDRITTAEVKRLLGKQITASKFENVKKDPDVMDEFGLTKIFDYKIDGKYILTIGFEYKQGAFLSKELKRRLYDLENLNEDVSDIKIVVDDLASDSPTYEKFENNISQISKEKKLNVEIVKVSKFND
ncbi:DUF3037 domain-containing protein [Weissella viridescens]|uniref:DUF3037 domain-containing protein n=1 Tax=Weissella viridescens TaxID=1629 RepID=A0A0R2GZQ3_WEIVI|nr:DUF3037 domain-containing protein [Weissella viridescens]KRN46227.1 hypothetical protein IV50_GL001212 [Weissella viridescens]